MELTAEKILRQLREAESAVIAARHELKSADERVRRLRATLASIVTHSQPISSRKLQLLSFLRTGKQNKEIAQSLGIEVRTVKAHLSELFIKFGVSNRTELLVATASIPLNHEPPENNKIVSMRSA